MCCDAAQPMTDKERATFQRLANLFGHHLYVFRSEDEAGEPIWVYTATPPMTRRCIIIRPKVVRWDEMGREIA